MIVRSFIGIVILWALLRAGLLTLAWKGNEDPAARVRVLKHFTEDDITRGRNYIRQGFAAKVALPYVQVAFLLYLVFTGLSGWFYDRMIEVCGGFWLPTSLYALLLFAVLRLLSLPFDFYLGYWCEQAAGFSNQTAQGWLWTYAKRTFLGWSLQLITLIAIIWTLRIFPRVWPLLVPTVITGFSLIVTLLFPILITPMFYEQKPLAAGPLRDRILEIAAAANVPVEDVYEIDESRYSKHTNAYFTGLFSKKRIVLYDTLIKSHTVNEAALIFAHEVGHWKHDHMRIGFTLAFLGTLAVCLIAWLGFPYLQQEPALHLREIWHPVNLPFFLIVAMVSTLFFSPLEAQISQYFEREADRVSLELTQLKQVFIDAEVRLARDNHAELLPHPLRVFWLYSHPPTIERIRMAEEFVPNATLASPAH